MKDEIYELEPVAEDRPTPLTDETLLSLAEQAEKRIDAMVKIKKIAIKLTNKHDWVDQGGKPYLQVSGAEKIGRMFGISWKVSEPVKETLEGGHFSYTYKGYFSLAGATIEAIGTRSSRDGFFKKYGYSNGKKELLPASEIDAGDVKKAAYTNCIGSGITRILGIRNMTYEDLKEFAGITPEVIGKVDFKKEGKADVPISVEGAVTRTFCPTDIRKKTGKNKKGQEYTIFIIKHQNDEFSTFSETFAKIAKEAMSAGRQVVMEYTTDQYGNKIDSLVMAERDPGEEG